MNGDTAVFDSVLDLCRHQHRRIVLGVLAAERESLALEELTEAVLEYNHGTPIAEVSADVVGDVRLTLHHEHLPRLAAEGLIDYDPETQVVTPTEEFDQTQPMLDAVLDIDPALGLPIEL